MAAAQVLKTTHTDDLVASVDNRIVAVIDGANTFSIHHHKMFNRMRLDGKHARAVIQQAEDEVDQMKRS